MDNFTREANYRRANGNRPLTPTQRRRLNKRRHRPENAEWQAR